MEPEQIKFEAPPMSMNSDQIPLLLRMGGSMVTSGRSLLAGNVTSMISSVLFPILNSKYTEKQKQEYEERRHEKYDAYLKDKEKQILIEKNIIIRIPPVYFPLSRTGRVSGRGAILTMIL